MKTIGNEGGAVFVLVGLALFILAAFIGLATDAGVVLYVQNQGQAAVDTAALAGASGIPQYSEEGDDSVPMARIAALDGANDVRGQSADLGGGGAGTTVEFLVYDAEADEFTCESGCDPDAVNAVRVTKAGYDAPLFYSWARAAFASDAPTSVSVGVSATGYLGCPAEIDPDDGGIGPIVLRECKIGFPDSCDVPTILQTSNADDNSAFTTFNLKGSSVCGQIAEGDLPDALQDTVRVGDTLNLVGTGQTSSCLKKLDDRFQHCTPASCASDPPEPSCVLNFPVIDCAGSESEGIVVGFAKGCIRNITSPPEEKLIDAEVECGSTIPGGPGGGCFGTLATRPILIR